ncbi:protein phosphatase CheZ [Desulfovibrio sp. OttesenSCG-928-C06]|nr:protein phosphatase CheZ [Desulfovibrio sp. OttesenSCG-928-C06]
MTTSDDLSSQIRAILKEAGTGAMTPEQTETINRLMKEQAERTEKEKDFHKRLNEDMLSGLNNIYKEIAKISGDGQKDSQPSSAEEASAVFHEAKRQLDEIMATTYSAADDIMNRAESIQDNQQIAEDNIAKLRAAGADPAILDILSSTLASNMEAITAIVTSLSFQDLTGQRIKKVVNALGSVHNIVVETYISAGLMLKKTEEEPEKDFETIEKESRQQAEATVKGSDLKGPTLDSSQKDVDDLLAQLGL